jgi:GntR family histidine utilization transcriptional repressor
MSLDDTTLSLHARIRADIEGAILSGTLKPGDRIPFEHELMAQYGCARMTVNKALTGLVEAGLLDRRRRAGTFVSRPQIHMAALAIPDIQAEVTGRGQIYRLELLSRDVLPAASVDPERMRPPRGAKVLALTCRHLADGVPFAVEERLISLKAVPDAATVDFTEVAPGSWLLAHVPWTEAEHRITAAPAGRLAGALGVDEGTACLVLDRRTWRGDQPITHVRQVFPGQGFDLVARFTGAAGGGA